LPAIASLRALGVSTVGRFKKHGANEAITGAIESALKKDALKPDSTAFISRVEGLYLKVFFEHFSLCRREP
jgi:hypothetical protein